MCEEENVCVCAKAVRGNDEKRKKKRNTKLNRGA